MSDPFNEYENDRNRANWLVILLVAAFILVPTILTTCAVGGVG